MPDNASERRRDPTCGTNAPRIFATSHPGRARLRFLSAPKLASFFEILEEGAPVLLGPLSDAENLPIEPLEL
jgi:hypothetical protein